MNVIIKRDQLRRASCSILLNIADYMEYKEKKTTTP